MNEGMESYCSFMEKRAINPFSKFFSVMAVGGEVTHDLVLAGLAMAAMAGGSIGWGSSKMSSPGKRDFKNIQRDFLERKLRKEVATRSRDLALSDMTGKLALEAPKERSMRI